MSGLGGSGIIEYDLEDDVDPCTVDSTDDEGWIVGVRVGCGVGVEQEGGLIICFGVVDIAAAECPIVVCTKAAELEDVSCIGSRRGLAGRVRDQEIFVERNDGGTGI